MKLIFSSNNVNGIQGFGLDVDSRRGKYTAVQLGSTYILDKLIESLDYMIFDEVSMVPEIVLQICLNSRTEESKIKNNISRRF